MIHILDHLDEGIDTIEFELHREESIPDINEKKNSKRKYQLIYDIIEKFAASDMDVASVEIPSNLNERNKMLLSQAMRTAASINGVKTNKRGDKIYLSKINKED